MRLYGLFQSGPALKDSEVRENLYVAAQSTLDDVFYRGHVRTKVRQDHLQCCIKEYVLFFFNFKN